ncbi:MAG: sugar transferase, partial [Solobacterium sp.]|nr:sugar transferase [Solobacterium sp.]
WRYSVAGFVLTDENEQKNLGGIRVIGNQANMFEKLSTLDYDAILIDTEDTSKEEITVLTKQFFEAGKIIHMGIRELEIQDVHRFLDNVGDVPVVTYRMVSPMSRRQLLAKRMMNLLGALLLLVPFLVLWLIAAIFTTLESPGPILVPRVRVGRNNTRFYQYRFRVFRVDARERVQAGKMPYTVIGRIYRALHFDGAPMILNILVGEMGFIGPKAPNLAKYLEMSVKERNLLMAVPGVIGYWSCEKDHEHLVEDEKGYIEDWSLFKDLTILALTGIRYITHHSLRFDGIEHMREEYGFLDEIQRRRVRLPYDRSLWTKKPNVLYLFIKRLFDICVSLIAIVLLSPVYLILAILITSDDGGKPFYSHMRIGKDGRRFALFKFRSMRMDAGNLEDLLTPEQLEQYRKEFKIDEDPRITPIGNFIRKTSLDELPQFFNILFGDMSLIGPRPLVEKEVLEKYTEEEQAKLLSVTPGVTGYWQAYARNNATYETGERQKMEMYYVENQSLWLDIKIFFKTFVSVIQKEGAK